jgi:rare lipoprotein A
MAGYSLKKLLCVTTLVASTFAIPVVASAQSGIASIYSTADNGTRTASGVPLSNGAMTAAMLSVPLGSYVRVTNDRNGRSIVVRITDRGPYVHGRIIDLTPAAGRALGVDGLAHVTTTVVGKASRGQG